MENLVGESQSLVACDLHGTEASQGSEEAQKGFLLFIGSYEEEKQEKLAWMG